MIIYLLQLAKLTPLIVTGHSLGGSVASLVTLWLLESINQSRTKHVLCITFGSPLIGNKGLQQAISENSNWNSCFLHVAADKDLVPGLFISPQNRIATQFDSETAAYQPFGTFLLCPESGCTCIEDPEEVSELLVAMNLETVRNQNPIEELQTFDYTGIVERLESIVIFKGISKLGEFNLHQHRAGIILHLEAIGVKTPQQNSDINALIAKVENRERICALNKKVSDPYKRLNDMKVSLAYLEWYNKNSKIGYYDSYKNKRFSEDMDVNKFKKKLNYYWEKMVAEAERMSRKEEAATFRSKWLHCETAYRRMVEPLDIADYYSKGYKDYITKGRSQHYIKLEKWLEEARKPTNKPHKWKTDNVFERLTKDSCFWAHVEEALILCKSLRNSEEGEFTRENLIKFEEYVMEQIKNYAVSPEIFLANSSFMQWWVEYEEIMGTNYNSELINFMKNCIYQQYANGSLVLFS